MFKLFLIIATTTSIQAFANYNIPLLVKEVHEKNIENGITISTKCEIYNRLVLITKKVEDIESVRSKIIQVNGDMNKLINDADNGYFIFPETPEDGVINMYYAQKILQNGYVRKVKLFESSGDGDKSIQNTSKSAFKIRKFLDLNCN
ncbi:hypothetical protein [Silvanigrella aquatica]|uniref:Uncharacterized protein n=1 Tax=Silvanigrella aquatica TaxID=1915309 RepID=A0A1L4D333_9BACT|nr:hypothetical protein [Silvanigrella aquatica]APJ04613.1 hypothetical protein AXG55_12135 [Silvanigrella aquatica]